MKKLICTVLVVVLLGGCTPAAPSEPAATSEPLATVEPASTAESEPAPLTLETLPYIDAAPEGEGVALVNGNGAFLAVDGDMDTLVLSAKPCIWRFVRDGEGCYIELDKDPTLLFDLENAYYALDTRVHLYVNTGYPCQKWNLTENEGGFIITSAEKPEWCVLSREKGFVLGTQEYVTQNDIWRVVENGEWADSFTSPIEPPLYVAPTSRRAMSFDPSPELWARFDESGITDSFLAEYGHDPACKAQYLTAAPQFNLAGGCDATSVEFYTGSQPDQTYWSLVNWSMDCTEYMKRNGYTSMDGIGAYAGLQMVDGRPMGIMSMWETYFTDADGKTVTLVPSCIYPAGEGVGFSHEGSGTSIVTPFEWRAETWYRFVLRSWINEATDSTLCRHMGRGYCDGRGKAARRVRHASARFFPHRRYGQVPRKLR